MIQNRYHALEANTLLLFYFFLLAAISRPGPLRQAHEWRSGHYLLHWLQFVFFSWWVKPAIEV